MDVRERLRDAVADYRRWGNGPATATSVTAVAAEAITRLDAIAQLCDELLSAPTPDGARPGRVRETSEQ